MIHQPFDHRKAHEEHNNGKGKPGTDGRGLQGHHATTHQEDRRNGAFEDSLEQPLGLGGIRVAAGRDDIDDHGA